MEFNVKLQELRKQKSLTQEELAEKLYVSRTAISKWESGRGYPNIDSLKQISKLFGVTIDELLSGEELLCLAEEDKKEKVHHYRDLVYGLLDICAVMLLILPLFAERTNEAIFEVSLLSLTLISTYLKIIYYVLTGAAIMTGVLTLALQNSGNVVWVRIKSTASLVLNLLAVVIFVISLQPNAAIFMFVFLIIKTLILLKKQ